MGLGTFIQDVGTKWQQWYDREDQRIDREMRGQAGQVRNAGRQFLEQHTNQDTVLNHSVRDRSSLGGDLQHQQHVESHHQLRAAARLAGRPH